MAVELERAPSEGGAGSDIGGGRGWAMILEAISESVSKVGHRKDLPEKQRKIWIIWGFAILQAPNSSR